MSDNKVYLVTIQKEDFPAVSIMGSTQDFGTNRINLLCNELKVLDLDNQYDISWKRNVGYATIEYAIRIKSKEN